ncbi:hypothetical protein [Roseovarius sp. MMSF_3281]|uniref:hypothetical protein n=1 Tax=Roseovarius sp. MMSF_3281 TaxID=3046694 RepID=UPI00273ED0B4|nr:hypothetical protein [Roseovarius sp. MMSF_3281]
MTAESEAQDGRHLPTSPAWREIIMSGADSGQIEKIAYKHLLDVQRDQKNVSGKGR